MFFFGLALWNKLELLSGKGKSEDVKDFVSQGFFVTFCVAIAYVIDRFLLADMVSFVPEDLIPLGFFRIILLPFIFLIGAKIVGPSKEIRILRAPRPIENRKNKRK